MSSKTSGKDEVEKEAAKPGANIPKTPVSILQELSCKNNFQIKYDLVQIEGAVHEPTFKYRVTVGDLVSTGCGQSKKKAKHSAAKAMIEKLKTLSTSQNGSSAMSKVVADVPSLQVAEMISPYDDGISGNPVGKLSIKKDSPELPCY
jgi:RISC-loading complex subunit TARBP2